MILVIKVLFEKTQLYLLQFVYTMVLAQSVWNWAEKWTVLGSIPSEVQIMEGVLVVVKGARTTSEHCQGIHEQGTEPTNAHIEP